MTQQRNQENMRNTYHFGLNSYLMINTATCISTSVNPCKTRKILFDGYLIDRLFNNQKILKTILSFTRYESIRSNSKGQSKGHFVLYAKTNVI